MNHQNEPVSSVPAQEYHLPQRKVLLSFSFFPEQNHRPTPFGSIAYSAAVPVPLLKLPFPVCTDDMPAANLPGSG